MSYPTPVLNLDFVNSRQLGDKVAFSRLSPRIFTSRLGASITAADGVPCFDHDATTGICKGLYIRPAETIESTVYAADLASVDLTQLKGAAGEALWNWSEGTIVVDAITPNIDQTVLFIIGNSSNRITVYRDSGGVSNAYAWSSGAATGYVIWPAVAAATRFKLCYAFASGVSKISVSGGTIISEPGLVVPSDINTLWIGSLAGSLVWGGHIRSIQLYNRRIDDAYLPVLSAL